MSTVAKIAAAVLALVALGLGYAAFMLATRPAPPPPKPVVQRASAALPTYPVVVAGKPIVAGDRLAADLLKIERWPVQPANGYAESEALLGQMVRQDIPAGEPVTAPMLARGLARHLAPGERAVTIAVDELSGAQNRILPGDLVDVFVVMDRGIEVPGTQTRLLQSRIKVLAYGQRSVDGPPQGEEKPSVAQRGQPPAAPRNAMLAVPVERVNELLLAAKAGRLQLVLRSPEDVDVPDLALFPERAPVLALRAGLTAEQQRDGKDGVNQAYAGEILPQLAGPTAAPVPKPRAAGGGGGRSIEVVRGGDVQAVRY
ncbi:Flp pilus assembly protein CpaB [Bordetella bronchiseptica MBORD762]|uniref:Flp pilus assembly protein CpaB n=1 Tax=Bordetella bronchiseptica TaxID=518 RepID=UPI000461B940|nr:Flp pilus assembly protein CpaB [Bordetella bronchiseptica]KDD95638.1 Flp pilus assembly protein CpaB [Bordetella bronchiseptica MBORD762]